MKKTIGMMIRETLIEKNMKQSALGRGLCKKSALSKYLHGTWRMDRLLLTCFLQRIGKSASKFSLLLTEEEYAYFEWQHQIYLAQLKCDWKKLEEILKEKECGPYTINEVLQRQYVQMVQALVAEKVYHNREESIRLIEAAINITVPDFKKGIQEDTLLSTQEICCILMWQNLQPDKEEALEWVETLLDYLRMHYDDRQELARIFPRVVGQYLMLLRPKKEYEICLRLSEEAIQLMIAAGYDYSLEKFLEIYVEAAEALKVEEKLVERKIQLKECCELAQDIGYISRKFEDELLLLDVWQEMELLQEVLAVSRREFAFSQEELSRDICEPKTISRIETGKSVPQHETYKRIARKLQMPEEYYFSVLETDDFEVLELAWELESRITRNMWDEALEIIITLENMADLENKRNLQYLEKCKYSCVKDEYLPEQQMHELIKILQLTMPQLQKGDWKKTEFWDHYFRKTEILILIRISDVLMRTGQYDEAKILLLNMYQYYIKQRVSIDLYYRTALLIIARLTSVFLKFGQYDEVFFYVNEGIRISEMSGVRRILGGLVNNKAYALELTGHKEEALKYYKWATYLSDMIDAPEYAKVSRMSYEGLIGHAMEWYN